MSDDDLVLTAREWCPLCPEPIELGAYGMTEMERERAVVVHIRDAHPDSRAAALARDALAPTDLAQWIDWQIRVGYAEGVRQLLTDIVSRPPDPHPAPVYVRHMGMEHEPDDTVHVPRTRHIIPPAPAPPRGAWVFWRNPPDGHVVHPEWARPVLTSSSLRGHVFEEDGCIRCGLACDTTEPCR